MIRLIKTCGTCLLTLFIVQFCQCSPVSPRDAINPKGLESLEWGSRLQGLENFQFFGNFSVPNSRERRFIDLGTSEQKPNKAYQPCIAPGNKNGHCRHLSQCVLEEFRTNFAKFMDYMCIIERTYVGTCCPDNAETVHSSSLPAESLAGYLPAIAGVDIDDKPVWEVVDMSNATSPDNTISTKNGTSGDKEVAENSLNRKPRRPRGCGVSSKSKTRIVNGRPADPREWPWMAALLRPDADQYCGGVLITDRHVLTAAHCIKDNKTLDIKVRLGEYDFTKADETRALDFNVVDIRIHEDFNRNTYEHDIAILKLHRPTTFNTYIWPICLPPVGLTFENKSAIVTGWGTQYYGGPGSTILMEVAVPIWPQTRCARSFVQDIPHTSLCAGAFEGGRDACQ
ncbi:proclotting enzyme, partial [Orussus abietinus]|uniref:proclotting enzyme n=1 Tax=Orussus abietinus TaxID=222816 RepID=UPI000C715F35